jgi:hypoxanthine phosphoribosyltransferase
MQADIDRILISQHQIAQRIRELALQITADHAPEKRGGEIEITIIPILTGAFIFCADLIRHMPIAMKIGLMTVSSYPGKAVTSQGATSAVVPKVGDIKGRHVLLIDDVLDSGNTLRLVVPMLAELGPASVKVCVLLRKDRESARSVNADYVGFDIPDEFVVGYGLDFDNYYRNLPDIVTLKREVIEAKGD